MSRNIPRARQHPTRLYTQYVHISLRFNGKNDSALRTLHHPALHVWYSDNRRHSECRNRRHRVVHGSVCSDISFCIHRLTLPPHRTIHVAVLAVHHDPVHARARQYARHVGAGNHLPHAHGLLAGGKDVAETVGGLHDAVVCACCVTGFFFFCLLYGNKSIWRAAAGSGQHGQCIQKWLLSGKALTR